MMEQDELSLDELDKATAGVESLESRLGKLIWEYNNISNPNDKKKNRTRYFN